MPRTPLLVRNWKVGARARYRTCSRLPGRSLCAVSSRCSRGCPVSGVCAAGGSRPSRNQHRAHRRVGRRARPRGSDRCGSSDGSGVVRGCADSLLATPPSWWREFDAPSPEQYVFIEVCQAGTEWFRSPCHCRLHCESSVRWHQNLRSAVGGGLPDVVPNFRAVQFCRRGVVGDHFAGGG